MCDAVLFGVQRGRRSADELLGKVFAGVYFATVLCAAKRRWDGNFTLTVIGRLLLSHRRPYVLGHRMVGVGFGQASGAG
ncbi:hypothetical protein [Streptomyces sp. NPDC048611]|uniref:hypothetical protein n=1 Tax=Streptomyces sp. NPDC048611 TaxID=3155635 RepID=UPI00342B42D7